MAYIEMKHSYKRYKTGDVEIIANNDITFVSLFQHIVVFCCSNRI